MNSLSPRGLDHLVLPTSQLSTARLRLETLGFQIAPDGVHPFGTVNCCVYFSDDTFIEPLAVADVEKTRSAVAAGNMFISHDQSYRLLCGDEGFSAVVFGTDDATADHRSFVETGISAGDMLEFSRVFLDSDGNLGTASFRLAFAAHDASPAVLTFTCQRINTPNVDRAALQQHPNGVKGISRIVVVSDQPAAFGDFAVRVINDMARADDQSATFDLGGCVIEIVNPSGLKAGFGSTGRGATELAAIVFSVTDLAATRKLLEAAEIDVLRLGGRLVVPPAAGQGAVFAFEEQIP